jgi:hypothetical protein
MHKRVQMALSYLSVLHIKILSNSLTCSSFFFGGGPISGAASPTGCRNTNIFGGVVFRYVRRCVNYWSHVISACARPEILSAVWSWRIKSSGMLLLDSDAKGGMILRSVGNFTTWHGLASDETRTLSPMFSVPSLEPFCVSIATARQFQMACGSSCVWIRQQQRHSDARGDGSEIWWYANNVRNHSTAVTVDTGFEASIGTGWVARDIPCEVARSYQWGNSLCRRFLSFRSRLNRQMTELKNGKSVVEMSAWEIRLYCHV